MAAEHHQAAKDQAIERAARKLREAMRQTTPEAHADDTYAEVSSLVSAILVCHPPKTFSVAQQQAIIEIIASVQRAYSIAARPRDRWLTKIWRDFCCQQPWEQVKSLMLMITFVTTLVGAASLAWSYSPSVLRWIANSIPEERTRQKQIDETSNEESPPPAESGT